MNLLDFRDSIINNFRWACTGYTWIQTGFRAVASGTATKPFSSVGGRTEVRLIKIHNPSAASSGVTLWMGISGVLPGPAPNAAGFPILPGTNFELENLTNDNTLHIVCETAVSGAPYYVWCSYL